MKVILADIKVNGDWINLKDNNNREISVSTKDRKTGNPINQKLKATLLNAKSGDEVEMDVREWKDKDNVTKYFGNEAKDGGSGKKFTPKDKSFEAAQTAALACATLYANKTAEEQKNFPKTFENIHKMIMDKATKSETN